MHCSSTNCTCGGRCAARIVSHHSRERYSPGSAATTSEVSELQKSLRQQQAKELSWLAGLRHKRQCNNLEHVKVMQCVKQTACSTLQLQHLAQTDLDWSEFKNVVPKYQLPQPESSFAASMGDKPAAVYCSDKRKPYMARTVSSKARSAGNLQRRTCDSALPVSAMYQGRQQAQMWAEIDEEGCNLRSSSDSHLQGPTSSSNAQPYLHAYTGGLAHTYGSRLRDQPRIAADLVNSMREGASSPRAPKVTSQIVAKSRLWPVAAAEGHLTVRRQASAYVPLLKGKSLPA